MESTSRFSWPEALFLFFGLLFLLQLFPAVWWGAVSVVDVRAWTWKSYASASLVAIVVLTGTKAWQNR